VNCEKHWSACHPQETGKEIELPVALHFHLPEKSTEDLDRTGDSLLLHSLSSSSKVKRNVSGRLQKIKYFTEACFSSRDGFHNLEM